MPSVAEARATVVAVHGAEAKLLVGASEATADGSVLEVTTSDAGFEAATGRGGRPQVSAFEILLNDVAVDMKNVTGNISVTRSYDNRLQTWNFQLILTTPTGPLGSPFTCIGPPTGKRRVTINALYKIPSGALAGSVVRVPIITDGIADNSSREASGEGTYTESISGVCRGGRYDQEVVTLVLPPGHGFPRGRVARLILERLGETQINVEDGNPMYKEVQIVDGDGLAVVAEQQEVENRRILWDTRGYFVNPKIGRPRTDESAWITLDERDWLDLAIVSVAHKADVLTDVTLTGTEQMLDGPCGLEAGPPRETRTFADYARATPAYHAQGSYGSVAFNANPLNPDTIVDERLVQLVRYTQDLRCGTLIHERTETYGWKNPLAVRQKFSTNAGGVGIHDWVHQDCYTNDNDETSRDLAYQYAIEQWTITNITETWHFYYQQDHTWDWATSVSPSDPEWPLIGPEYQRTIAPDGYTWQGVFVGLYLGSITRVSGYTFPRRAVYTRSIVPPPLDPFDSLEPNGGVGIIGSDGHDDPANPPFNQSWQMFPAGDKSRGEGFLPLSETFYGVFADSDGYTTKEQTRVYEYAHVPTGIAAKYKYGDGSESSEENDTWRNTKSYYILYISTGESEHKVITSNYEFGNLVGGTEDEGVPGDRPAADRMEIAEWPEDLYQNDEEFQEFAGLARRSHTRQIKVQVTAPGLLTCHTAGILKTDVPLAETEDELEAIGRFLIDESLAADVQGTVLFNAYLNECQVIHAAHRPIGLDHDVRIQSVTHSGPPEGPITTALTAKLYGGEGV